MPATQYLHPEFGILAPSARLRSRLKIVAVSAMVGAVIGMVAGASSTAVLLSDHRVEGVDTSALADSTDPRADAAAEIPGPPPSEPQRAQAPCETEGWVRLEGKCLPAPPTRKVLVRAPADENVPPADDRTSTRATPTAPAAAARNGTAAASAAAPADEAAAEQPAQPAVTRPKRTRAATRTENRRRNQYDAWSRRDPRGEFWDAQGYAGRLDGRGRFSGYPAERSWQWGW